MITYLEIIEWLVLSEEHQRAVFTDCNDLDQASLFEDTNSSGIDAEDGADLDAAIVVVRNLTCVDLAAVATISLDENLESLDGGGCHDLLVVDAEFDPREVLIAECHEGDRVLERLVRLRVREFLTRREICGRVPVHDLAIGAFAFEDRVLGLVEVVHMCADFLDEGASSDAEALLLFLERELLAVIPIHHELHVHSCELTALSDHHGRVLLGRGCQSVRGCDFSDLLAEFGLVNLGDCDHGFLHCVKWIIPQLRGNGWSICNGFQFVTSFLVYENIVEDFIFV